ncbi:MAG: protein translocase subunit SecD [Gammaproteobacteria bacterium]|nr:protein translocase subunit SecD [Gammaproteobacteria bacterium]
MNQYPLWKYLLILAVIVIGSLYALPNLYGDNPAVQVSATRDLKINTQTRDQIIHSLKNAGLSYQSISLEGERLLIRFTDTGDQLRAADVLTEELERGYVVALNLASATPDWLKSINALPMYLGLDLRGGVHFLMEVDMDAAVNQSLERYVGELRSYLRGEKVRYLSLSHAEKGVQILFRNIEIRDQAQQLIRDEYRNLILTELDGDKPGLLVSLSEQEQADTRAFAVQQNITTLRNRVNELGVAEPVIQQQGKDRIVVQLPGVQDTARAKEILGATATLEFRLVDEKHSVQDAIASKRIPAGSRLYRERDGNPVLLKKSVILTGDYITDASSGLEQNSGSPAVFINLDGKGAHLMENATKDNIGNLMAVVFIENKVETRQVNGEAVKTRYKLEEVINIARIRDRLSRRFQITGLDDTRGARDLALLLRAGALAAPIEIIEERTVGPSLGKENIEQGFMSVVIGFVLVLIFMAFYYRVFGLIANIALTLNLILIVAILSMLQATLTLPGIAGMVLVVGMAVDANVLIFERIREELRAGNSIQASINAGYEKALSTIADANITTLIAAVVLFSFGTGPIKGFAVTLSIGILCSMFTAIMGTRALVNLIYGGRQTRKLSI